jgi:hypothetical protein
MRNLAVFSMFLALAGCSAMSNFTAARSSYKGQPLSAVVTRLGPPTYQQTIEGQKVYTWDEGQSLQPCHIRVVMAGDVIDSYETSGDEVICVQYQTR